MSTDYTAVFGNYSVSPSFKGFLSLTAANDYDLLWPTPGQNVPVGSTTQATIAGYNNINATVANVDINMPDAKLVSTGTAVVFTNVGNTHSFTLNDFDGNQLAIITVGSSVLFYLTDNSTQAGQYTSVPYAGGVSAVTSVGLASAGGNLGNITVSSSTTNPITSNGVFTLTLANDLLGLIGFGSGTGYPARTAANTWAIRTFTSNADQIVLTNPGGVAGATDFALAADIEGIDSITLDGGLSLDGAIVSNTQAGNLIFEVLTAGTYLAEFRTGIRVSGTSGNANQVQFYEPANVFYTSFEAGDMGGNIRYVLPVTAPNAVDQVLKVSSIGASNTLEWANIPTFPGVSTEHAIARYSNTTGSLENSGVLISDTNAITGATSLTLNTNNTITTALGALILDPNGSSPVEIKGLSYPLSTNTGNLESCCLTADGLDNIIFSANVNENLLINGAMDIWQRNTSFTNATFFVNNSGIYTADGYWLETGINAAPVNDVVNVAQFARAYDSATCSFNYVMRFTIVNTGNKFVNFQFMESTKTAKVAGQVASFSFVCASSAAANIRAALVSWTGAADTLTKPVITAFNAAGTNPTLAASYTYLGVADPINTPITTNLARFKFENIDVPDTCVNLVAMVWYDDASAANTTTLDISAMKIEQGPTCTAFKPEEIELETIKCQRYIRKSWPLATAVGTAATINAKAIVTASVTPVADDFVYGTHKFDYPMRTTPTVNLYAADATPNVATALAADGTAGANQAANSATVLLTGPTGFTIQNTSGGNIASAATTAYIVHYYADASL